MTTSILSTIRRHPATRYVRSFATTTLAVFAMLAIGQAMGAHHRGEWHTPAFAVPVHLATVLPALPMGLWILLSRKGDATHKLLGRIWAMLMMVTALDSLLIRQITGALGPIHIFSFITLVSIPYAIWQVRRGNIGAHRRAMTGPYIGLIVAGLFALMPGRLLGDLIFG